MEQENHFTIRLHAKGARLCPDREHNILMIGPSASSWPEFAEYAVDFDENRQITARCEFVSPLLTRVYRDQRELLAFYH